MGVREGTWAARTGAHLAPPNLLCRVWRLAGNYRVTDSFHLRPVVCHLSQSVCVCVCGVLVCVCVCVCVCLGAWKRRRWSRGGDVPSMENGRGPIRIELPPPKLEFPYFDPVFRIFTMLRTSKEHGPPPRIEFLREISVFFSFRVLLFEGWDARIESCSFSEVELLLRNCFAFWVGWKQKKTRMEPIANPRKRCGCWGLDPSRTCSKRGGSINHTYSAADV